MSLSISQVSRVYKDKLAEAKDIDMFDKSLKEILKKTFDEHFSEAKSLAAPLIYCHFAKGVGEPKYMPINTWDSLLKLLMDALKVAATFFVLVLILIIFCKGYNELNSVMDLVLFEDAMSHVCRINRILEVVNTEIFFQYNSS